MCIRNGIQFYSYLYFIAGTHIIDDYHLVLYYCCQALYIVIIIIFFIIITFVITSLLKYTICLVSVTLTCHRSRWHRQFVQILIFE